MNQQQQQQQYLNDQILEYTSKSTDKSTLKEWLKKYDLNTRNARGQTILHLIAMYNNMEGLKYFLKKKYVVFKDTSIDVDQRDEFNYTPLHCAVNQGSFEIAKKFLSRGADPNARTSSGSTPLHLLSKFCHSLKSIKLAKQLIECGAYINHKDGKQETPLHRATMLNDNFDYLKVLLYHGANPNIVNKRGRTCQHISIEQGKVDLLELFLMYGADFNKPTSMLPSPMEMAAVSPFPQIKQFFLERISPSGENILMIEKQCFLGKPTSTFFINGDSFSTGNSTQLYTGKLYITNFRIVFKIDQPTITSLNSINSNNNFSPNSSISSTTTNSNSSSSQFPLLEDEEDSIPLLCISSLRTDDEKDQSNEMDSLSSTNRESIIIPTNHNNSDYYFSSEITNPNGGNIIDDYLVNPVSNNNINNNNSANFSSSIGSNSSNSNYNYSSNNNNSSCINNNNTSTTVTTSLNQTSIINVTNSNNSNNNSSSSSSGNHTFSGHFSINQSATTILNNIINFSKNSLNPYGTTSTSNNTSTTTPPSSSTTLSPPLSPSQSLDQLSPSNQILNSTSSSTNNNNNNIVTSTSTNNLNSNNNNIIMNYQLINIETKDFKQFKLYFMSLFVRDKILELINYHFKDKVERTIKVNSQNKNIQKKIVEENIQMQDESRVEHIDRYESYGIFEETVPYLFAFLYKMPGFPCNGSSSSSSSGGHNLLSASTSGIDGWQVYNQRKEYARFNIFNVGDSDNSSSGSGSCWRFTTINKDHRLCSSYPTSIVVLSKMVDKDLEKIFSFRSKGRVPALSWKDPSSNASLSRCSQPLVGIERTRCLEDELYCSNLALNAPSKTLYVVDARPKLNAIANTANGAGFENIHNYPNCKLVFMNIPNIHVIRKSLEKLSSSMKYSIRDRDHAESSDTRWWGYIEETGWISHIKSILEAASLTADLITKGNSVLVHCSDGWDRTPQICSLSQILLDPFYRTIYGFQVLIEKEWLSFGHKFSLRLGHLPGNEEERSPIFQQFLDCCFQLCNQFPLLFEFTPTLLLFLSDHLHSCKYGTFLNNCEKDRIQDQVKLKTISIWTEVNLNVGKFLNPYYNPQTFQSTEYLKPKLYSRCLELWKSCYMRSECKDFWMHSNWLLHNSNFNNNSIYNNNNHQVLNCSTELYKLSLLKQPTSQQQQQSNQDSIDRSSISSNNSGSIDSQNWIPQIKHSQQSHSPLLASHRPSSTLSNEIIEDDIDNNNNEENNLSPDLS